MGRPQASFSKRQREQAKRERQQRKAEKRAQQKIAAKDGTIVTDDELTPEEEAPAEE